MSGQFRDLIASELYCPKCARSQPLRERLLLILPDGELHEYLCRRCGTSLGERKVTGPRIAPPPPPGRRQPPSAGLAPRPPRGLLR